MLMNHYLINNALNNTLFDQRFLNICLTAKSLDYTSNVIYATILNSTRGIMSVYIHGLVSYIASNES